MSPWTPFVPNGYRSRFRANRALVVVLDRRRLGDLTGLLAAISLISFTIPAYAGGFISTPSYPAGIFPQFVAVGDFNGDAIPDLAVTNAGYTGSPNGTVSILLGKGDGSFQAPVPYAVGFDLGAVAVADFNGDGHLDLAVVGNDFNSDHGIVTVLLGNGDGTFQVGQAVTVRNYPSTVSVRDFDGDGHPDLVLAGVDDGNDSQGWVSFLLGNGDGTFRAAQSFALGSELGSIAVAVGDFNSDGVPDVAAAYYNTGSILLGKGDGTFHAPQRYLVAAVYSSIVLTAADFNGDSKIDLAVSSSESGLLILLGNGDGTFHAGPSYAIGDSPLAISVADFNGDGIPDLAVAAAGSGTLRVLLGHGDGSFQAAQNYYALGSFPACITVADFNGDGNPDVAAANANSDTVNVLLGDGGGKFQAARSYPTGFGSGCPAVADFNGDGIPDLAFTNYESVSVLLGNGDGSFKAPQTYPVAGNPTALAVGDFNGDGVPDIAVAIGRNDRFVGTMVTVFLGNGDGTFRPGLSFDAGTGPNSLAVADFNGDGKQDIVTADFASYTDRRGHLVIVESDLRIFLGSGDGTFQAGQTYHLRGNNPNLVAVGDFNGDGIPDLAAVGVSNAADKGMVSILFGNGDGTFQDAKNQDVGAVVDQMALGDFNQDGHLDLALTYRYLNRVSILMGNGDGSFPVVQSYAPGSIFANASSVAVGDFNKDGFPDVVFIIYFHGTVCVMLGNGDGTFQPAHYYTAGCGGSVAVGDFNGDGYADLAVGNGDYVTILLNSTNWGGGP